MKKILALILVCLTALSLFACGKSAGDTPKDTTPVQNTTPNGGNSSGTQNPVSSLFFPATSPATGAYATIKIAASVKMDDESAWLGLCPAGKNYITEEEADEVDVIWFHAEPREENDPYVFACDFTEVEDGTYALVVCTSDEASVGYVVIQMAMTKSGEKLTFDIDNAQLKSRPAN